eukprot:3299901-Pyramimonas_sp.AAC.1
MDLRPSTIGRIDPAWLTRADRPLTWRLTWRLPSLSSVSGSVPSSLYSYSVACCTRQQHSRPVATTQSASNNHTVGQ